MNRVLFTMRKKTTGKTLPHGLWRRPGPDPNLNHPSFAYKTTHEKVIHVLRWPGNLHPRRFPEKYAY